VGLEREGKGGEREREKKRGIDLVLSVLLLDSSTDAGQIIVKQGEKRI